LRFAGGRPPLVPAAVDVFYGHPLGVKSEIEFLERLRRDLIALGISARVLANLEVGRRFQQLDFFIVTEHRAVLCEQKCFRYPVIGHANGVWQEVIADKPTPLGSNPTRQARQGVYELSDTFHDFVRATGAPGPARGRFYKHIDTVVCLYPAIPAGSRIDKHPHVTHLGYEELLDRLAKPGPKPPWTASDWDALVRHLALIAEDEDTEEARSRRASEAALREYAGLFASGLGERMPPIVDTKVVVEDERRTRPELMTDLVAGGRS
jgi:nuclease-like protein